MICRVPLRSRARRVALILMDVDGVLTDGGIFYAGPSQEGRIFDAKDGVALAVARRAGLLTGVLSGRGGAAVRRRARELRMDEIHLDARNKLPVYERILRRRRLNDSEVCYIGDDLVDLPVMERAGMAVGVADAHPEVRRQAAFVTRARGGRGAVREVIDAILQAQGRWATVMGWFAGGGS